MVGDGFRHVWLRKTVSLPSSTLLPRLHKMGGHGPAQVVDNARRHRLLDACLLSSCCDARVQLSLGLAPAAEAASALPEHEIPALVAFCAAQDCNDLHAKWDNVREEAVLQQSAAVLAAFGRKLDLALVKVDFGPSEVPNLCL